MTLIAVLLILGALVLAGAVLADVLDDFVDLYPVPLTGDQTRRLRALLAEVDDA